MSRLPRGAKHRGEHSKKVRFFNWVRARECLTRTMPVMYPICDGRISDCLKKRIFECPPQTTSSPRNWYRAKKRHNHYLHFFVICRRLNPSFLKTKTEMSAYTTKKLCNYHLWTTIGMFFKTKTTMSIPPRSAFACFGVLF